MQKTKKLTKYIHVSAYNGSLTSSLASPTLSKPLNTFDEIAKESSSLNILLRNDSFQTEFMRTSGNKNLQTIYERSERRGPKRIKAVEVGGINLFKLIMNKSFLNWF